MSTILIQILIFLFWQNTLSLTTIHFLTNENNRARKTSEHKFRFILEVKVRFQSYSPRFSRRLAWTQIRISKCLTRLIRRLSSITNFQVPNQILPFNIQTLPSLTHNTLFFTTTFHILYNYWTIFHWFILKIWTSWFLVKIVKYIITYDSLISLIWNNVPKLLQIYNTQMFKPESM